MTAFVAVLATLVAILSGLGVAGLVVYRRREMERAADAQLDVTLTDRLMDGLYVEKVIVTLRSGESFGGLFADSDSKSVLLHNAEAFLEGGRKVPVDGELLIPRADVLYFQRP